MFRQVIAAGAILMCAVGSGLAQTDPGRVLVVEGTGEAAAVPDMARITLGVVITDQNASTALAEVSRAVQRTLNELARAGIEPRDIQTSGVSVQPLYDNGRLTSGVNSPRIKGFEARNSLRVTVRELETLGAVLDDLVRSGANQVSGVQFDVAVPAPLLDQARINAVAEAQRKADVLAKAAGVTLGPLLELREGSGGGPQPFARAQSFASDVPIAPGEVQLRATVTMIYQLGTP